MPFSDTPRVIYERNPLVEVICQIRFPAILRIDAESPVDFQEKIRDAYPLFREEPVSPVLPELPAELRPVLGELLGATPATEKTLNRFFQSEDEVWTVTLGREFLALTTTSYETWDGFRGRLDEVFQALMAVYRPTVFTRIGLRYRNLIRRPDRELSTYEWKDLIAPHIAGPLATDAIAGRTITEAKGMLALEAGAAGAAVTLRHGLVEPDGPEKGELAYVIDSDFYTEERIDAEGILNFLDGANAEAGRLFRWCITTELHEALRPRVV